MATLTPFTGSYAPDAVRFLLTPVTMPDTPVHAKEALIQSGQQHYSQLLSHETLPEEDYLALFYQAMAANKMRVAGHVALLAERILATRPHGVTLVSLARAGTPVGVLLKQVLKRHFNTDAAHYSVSILRDVGIDRNALRYIVQHHALETLVFVDGWTGKGVIARQLAASLQDFAHSDGVSIPAELYVLTDLSGDAAVAASSDDYLIPSCILNATVSGLVSRSVYDKNRLGATDFHGCVYYEQFKEHDLSNYFVAEILSCVDHIRCGPQNNPHPELDREQLQTVSQALLQRIAGSYQVSSPHYIKPGIGEATRVLLRREARLLLLQDLASEATRHLLWLAEAKSVPVEECKDLPYHAVALIKEMHYD
ncbi:MAG: tellurite-like stress resistance cysteine protease StiP [Methylovulum sp.]|nr:tellurite-like stress resistance cysteine protease StiP [Methylovulum sp.]